MKKCRKTSTETVYVKTASDNYKWKMKLQFYDGKFWLEEGWPEFAKHYNLKRGYTLTFRYDGNSDFNVIIFDINTIEINYPSVPDTKEFLTPKKEVINGDEVSSSNNKMKKAFALPCPMPIRQAKFNGEIEFVTPKKESMDATDFVKIFDEFPQPRMQSSEFQLVNVPQYDPNPIMTGMKTFFLILILDMSIFMLYTLSILSNSFLLIEQLDILPKNNGKKIKKRSKIPEHVKQLKGHEKSLALQMADGFRSKRPFIKVVMQPSFVYENRMTLSNSFAKEYIKNTSCDVILKVLEGRSWYMHFKYEKNGKMSGKAMLRSGWNKFAKENNLEVGDVCVFVLLEGENDKIVFEVVILRLNGDSKIPISYL
ncbi:B3 domain-containing transcription factor VRN1-like [Cannabis sativa]|uniref:B3 domain-containing transcription factor VRN1-like n=1 Tax=Cannabis sativa TaxID=3483 RepID=UPI0029CA5F81|nr:B3 domain-containing transcription factor VRN1-like [Cannabis sativa]